MMAPTRERPGGNPGAEDTQKLDCHYIASPADKLLSRLDRVKQTGPGRWLACCPSHDDRHPSLSVREADDGTLLLKCWSGCGAADVVVAAGLTLADLFPRRYERSPLRRGERWVPADVLRCVSREATVVLVAAEAVRQAQALSDEDMQRLALATQRLRDAASEVSHG